jgi:acetyl esterase/lipase
VVLERDVEYRNVDGLSLKLDVYMPKAKGTYPGLLWIHGGELRIGDKCKWGRIAAEFVSAGFTVYAVNYRLAPRMSPDDASTAACSDGRTVDITPKQGYPFPAGWEDVQAAVEWVRDNGERYRTDTSRIGAVGGSAGGYYSYMLGTQGLVEVQAGWSGPTKFEDFNPRLHANYIGCHFEECPEKWREAAPYYRVTSSAAPAIIFTSTDEAVPLSQAQLYAQRLEEAGVPHEVVVIAGDKHATAYGNLELDTGRRVWEETARFIKAHL